VKCLKKIREVVEGNLEEGHCGFGSGYRIKEQNFTLELISEILGKRQKYLNLFCQAQNAIKPGVSGKVENVAEVRPVTVHLVIAFLFTLLCSRQH